MVTDKPAEGRVILLEIVPKLFSIKNRKIISNVRMRLFYVHSLFLASYQFISAHVATNSK